MAVENVENSTLRGQADSQSMYSSIQEVQAEFCPDLIRNGCFGADLAFNQPVITCNFRTLIMYLILMFSPLLDLNTGPTCLPHYTELKNLAAHYLNK